MSTLLSMQGSRIAAGWCTWALVALLCSVGCKSIDQQADGPKGSAVQPGEGTLGDGAPKECRAGTLAMLGKAKDVITIQMFATPDVPRMEKTVAEVRAMLKDYAAHSGGKLVFEDVPVRTEEDKTRAREAKLQEMLIAENGATTDDDKGTSAFFGLVVSYRAESGPMTLSPVTTDTLPFHFANKLQETIAKGDGTRVPIGVLTGTSELALDEPTLAPPQGSSDPSLRSVVDGYFPVYEWVPVNADSIADDARGVHLLFVTQPGRDLTEAELKALDAFVMRGKTTLVVIASAVNLQRGDENFDVQLSDRGLNRLLEGYGITMRQDLVLDSDTGWQVTDASSGNVRPTRIAHVPVLSGDDEAARDKQQLNATFAGFFRLPDLAFPYASTLQLHPEKQKGATLRSVAQTSAAGSATTNVGSLQPGVIPSGTEPPGRRVIAAVLEGKVTSAFGDQTAESRVLIISSSAFSTNPIARALKPSTGGSLGMMGAQGPNMTLYSLTAAYARSNTTNSIIAFKNITAWGSGDLALVPCAAHAVSKP